MSTELAQYLDFANHHGNATMTDIERLCQGVVKYGFHAAFVKPYYIRLAKRVLTRSGLMW